MIEYLTLEDVMALSDDLEVGPIRDVGLLDSAVHRPQATVFGVDAYPEIDQKAAVLLESLVRNHALLDGNERIGWLAPVVFYGLNNFELDAPDDDAYDLVIAIAIASGVIADKDAAALLGDGTNSRKTYAMAATRKTRRTPRRMRPHTDSASSAISGQSDVAHTSGMTSGQHIVGTMT